MTNEILVPVDFSDASRAATRRAVPIAKALRAGIELLHVAPDSFAAHHGLAGPDFASIGELHAQVIDRALKSITHLAAELESESGVTVTSHVTSGQPIPAIVNRAKEIRARMIVAATHGRTGFDHFLMGSVCERILRVAPCPVYVAREPKQGGKPGLTKILATVDCSEHSRRALDTACDLALAMGAELDVLHVWEQPYFVRGGRPDAELIASLEKNAEQSLAEFMESVKVPASLQKAPELVVGAPAVTIIGRVNESPPDLIVMGTHGRSGLKHLFLGSVAETVTRYAPCSVLVVP